MANFFQQEFSRRHFVTGSMAALGAFSSLQANAFSPEKEISVQQLIDLILKEIPGKVANSVDTIKIGDPNQRVTSVVTSMFPTIAVIRKAIDLGANFLIVHEPTFYNHLDDTGWLEGDEVMEYKRALLTKHKIAVWRFHDYIHRHDPDGVLTGVVNRLGWKPYQDSSHTTLFSLPKPKSLKDIIEEAKNKLSIPNLRLVGDLRESCQRILLLPGAWGGRPQISQLKELKPDLLICGEVSEWETSEYVRDARAMGLKRSLLVLGHVQSEEPGLAWLVEWLAEKAPMIRAVHVPSQNPFTFA